MQTNQNKDQSQRDENGRFRKGNRGGPGNPWTRQSARLRKALLDAVSTHELRAVIRVLKEKAHAGDLPAIRLLLSYGLSTSANAIIRSELQKHFLEVLVVKLIEADSKRVKRQTDRTDSDR